MIFTDGGAIFRASTLFFLPSIVGKMGWLGRANPTPPLPALTTLTGTSLLILETYRTYSLFNSYKVTNKQSCNKIDRIFTCRPDPEGTAEVEGGFKEEEEAQEAQAVEPVEVVAVVKVVEEGEIKEEPQLELKIDQRSTFFLSMSYNILSPDHTLPLPDNCAIEFPKLKIPILIPNFR